MKRLKIQFLKLHFVVSVSVNTICAWPAREVEVEFDLFPSAGVHVFFFEIPRVCKQLFDSPHMSQQRSY